MDALLAGLRDERPDDAAQAELERRLRGLALAPLSGLPEPPRWEDWTFELVATPASGLTPPLDGGGLATLHRPRASLTS